MRFTRWWNPSLPQTLLIAVMLLYVNAFFSIIVVLGLPIGGSGYLFLPLALFRSDVEVGSLAGDFGLISLVAGLVYGFAGLAIANGQRIGWKVGIAVAAGAILLPLVAVGPGGVLGSTYVISYLFDVALLVALLHPQSREYQKLWFDGPTRQGPRRGR